MFWWGSQGEGAGGLLGCSPKSGGWGTRPNREENEAKCDVGTDKDGLGRMGDGGGFE